MSLVQQLILRALTALFWDKPYRQNPVPWGTQLHDRFLLPFFCAQDLNDVIEYLRRGGYAFKTEWFTARISSSAFPIQGQVTYAGVTMELRGALEPWHVLGEEGTAGGTVRYVDSSVEKLQVKIDNAIEGRHVVTCNGRACRCMPPARPASSWRASATAPGSRPRRCTPPFRSTRRSPSTWSTPGRAVHWVAASTT